jgi:hypothetical protein
MNDMSPHPKIKIASFDGSSVKPRHPYERDSNITMPVSSEHLFTDDKEELRANAASFIKTALNRGARDV